MNKEQNLRLLSSAQDLLASIAERVRSGGDNMLVRFDFQQDPEASIPRHVRLEVVVDITPPGGS